MREEQVMQGLASDVRTGRPLEGVEQESDIISGVLKGPFCGE